MADKFAMRKLFVAFIITLVTNSVAYGYDVAVMAIFEGKAIFKIDGIKHVLSVGERSPEGLRLIKTLDESVVVDIDGKRETLHLGSHATSAITAPQTMDVTLAPDSMGMYATSGSVNSQSMNFLVDTGATLIALSSQHAKQLGLDYRVTGTKSKVETASGLANAYYLKLKSVKIGAIELREVDAVVLDGSFPSTALLGMSFLSRVDMQRNGSALVLKKRY